MIIKEEESKGQALNNLLDYLQNTKKEQLSIVLQRIYKNHVASNKLERNETIQNVELNSRKIIESFKADVTFFDK